MRTITRTAAAMMIALGLGTGAQAQDTIRLGVSFFPFHSADDTQPDLLDAIAPELAAEGFTVEKKVFLNYAEANPALAHDEIDGNLIQHRLYMETFNHRAGAEVAIAQPVYHATFALYSGTYDDLATIPQDETIIIPNDGVNTARALLLLQAAGLITLAEGATYQASEADITANPRNLRFIQMPLTATAGAYDEGGRKLAVMYPTFARQLDLQGDAERLYVEQRGDVTDAYAISYAVNARDLDAPATKAVVKALQSEAAATFLRDHYGWAAVPVE